MTKVTSTETVVPYKLKVNGFIFVITMWLVSRLIIVVAMQLITPLLYTSPVYYNQSYALDFVSGFVPKPSWELFSHWDGKWYQRIATVGYDFADDGQQHSIAFFPLFPLISRAFIMLGLPFEVAGTLVNNGAFLGALVLVYRWTQERHGINAARWATAVLAWCPLSLYGTVIYTEGLFLLLTTAALQAFDKRQHVRAALWGAMATATRATGITLVPAFLLVAWRERRPAIAYGAGFAALIGLLLFSVYCTISFKNPLAFVHAQRAWSHPNWLNIFQDALTLGKDGLIKVVMVFGGGYLLWRLRAELNSVAVAYGFCSLALLITSPALRSVNRYAYGIVSLSLALGVLLSRHPRWGYAIVGWFAILLVYYVIDFARWNWVA